MGSSETQIDGVHVNCNLVTEPVRIKLALPNMWNLV